MAIIKLSITLETCDSKNFNFSPNNRCCSISSSFTGYYAHIIRPQFVSTSNRVKKVRISRFETDLFDLSVTEATDNSITETLISQNGKNRQRKNLGGAKIGIKSDSEFKFNSKSNEDGLYVDLSAISTNLSLEKCNFILKQLEEVQNDSKTLKFFEWMRSNGKLKHNVGAYNLALRVFGRQENWDEAEKLIEVMRTESDCELNFQVFNTLIYACSKRGLAKMGSKWFHKMLDHGVSPNIATIGMLMALYQKSWNVEEAEFTFYKMRDFNIQCQSSYSAMITIYTRMGLFQKGEEIIKFMNEDKVIYNLENWSVLLNAYSQQGKLAEAERALVTMQESGFPPNIIAYNTVITGFGKVSNMGYAQIMFKNLKNLGLEPDKSTFRSMIEGWGRAGNYKEAKWYYQQLKHLGFKPNPSNLYTMINLQAKHGDEKGVIQTLDDMVETGCQYPSMLGTVLQAYERAGRVDQVPLILKDSFYRHVLVNQTSCSILVMAYVKHCLVDEIINVLMEKQWNDPVFEDNLYHLLICSCKESGHLENAIKIYNTYMPTKSVNMHIISTMMDIYSFMGLFIEAENLYLKLKSSGISLDKIAFSIVIRMYIKAGSLEKACAVLETMELEKNINPDVYLFRDMLRIYQKCNMLEKSANLYYTILKSGVTWDEEMYNCVINCCARALPVDDLSRLFDEMLQCGFSPNTITINVMLDVYGKSKLFKKARKVFWIARKRGLIDVISYNTLISAYGQAKDLSFMKSTVRKMEFNNFLVSLEAYNCMLDAYGKEGQMENFKNVLQVMKEKNCISNHYTFNIMINIYGEQGWIDEIAEVLTVLKEGGLGPDLCSYNTLIKAYGIAGMVEEAVDLVKEMRENGIEPDKLTYVNLIKTLQRNDKFLEAVKWSLWMKQVGF